MGCIWRICFLLETFIFTGCFFQRTATKPALKQYRFRFNESNIQVFHSWLEDSMKFPDHKTRIIPRKRRKQPPKKKKKRTGAALHVGWLYVERSAICLRKSWHQGCKNHSCKQPPMSLHEMRPVLLPFVAPAGASPLRFLYFSGDILFQKSCTWYANNLSFKTVEIN